MRCQTSDISPWGRSDLPAATRDLVGQGINLARVAPDRRLQLLGRLAADVGNRGVARLALARSPVAPPAGGLPTVEPAAEGVLTRLGLSEANIAGFRSGQIVLFNMVVPGNDDTIGVLQLKPGLVRGGIFSIKVPSDAKVAIRAFAAARARVLDVARAVNVPEYELIGAAVHHSGIEKMLVRQKFNRTTEVLPEYLGLGPNAECEVFTKRFPVLPAVGGMPAPGSPAPADQAAREPEEPEPATRRRPRGEGGGPRGRRPTEARGLSGRGTTTLRGSDLRAGKTTVTDPRRSSPGTSSTASTVARAELEQAANELSAFRRVGRALTSALGTVLKYGKVPAMVALELMKAINAIEMTQSAIKGDGWILTRQVAQAKALANGTDALLTVYVDGRYHARLVELVEAALKNDEHFAELGVITDYWSSVELSEFCAGAYDQLAPHVDDSQKLSDDMTWMLERVRAGQDFCTKLLNDDAIWAAEALSAATSIPGGIVETLFAAQQDLDQIDGILAGRDSLMAEHLKMVKADLKLLDDNVLRYGLADVRDSPRGSN